MSNKMLVAIIITVVGRCISKKVKFDLRTVFLLNVLGVNTNNSLELQIILQDR